jgi:hypothetical protein
MAVFTQGKKSCYFIHIPRTAGRHVSSLFDNTDGVQCKYHKICEERLYGIDVTHLHHPLFESICPDDIPHITVVRNPYDKIFSSLRNMNSMHSVDCDLIMKDEFDCFKYIFEEILDRSFHNNWFLPQYKFISPNTHVWKYEWGFGKNFQRWVQKKTGIKLNISKTEYKKFDGETEDKSYFLSKESQRNIKKFYLKDYNKFNYRRW